MGGQLSALDAAGFRSQQPSVARVRLTFGGLEQLFQQEWSDLLDRLAQAQALQGRSLSSVATRRGRWWDPRRTRPECSFGLSEREGQPSQTRVASALHAGRLGRRPGAFYFAERASEPRPLGAASRAPAAARPPTGITTLGDAQPPWPSPPSVSLNTSRSTHPGHVRRAVSSSAMLRTRARGCGEHLRRVAVHLDQAEIGAFGHTA